MQPSAVILVDAIILKLQIQISNNSVLHKKSPDGPRSPPNLQTARYPIIAQRTKSVPHPVMLIRYVLLSTCWEIYSGGIS